MFLAFPARHHEHGGEHGRRQHAMHRIVVARQERHTRREHHRHNGGIDEAEMEEERQRHRGADTERRQPGCIAAETRTLHGDHRKDCGRDGKNDTRHRHRLLDAKPVQVEPADEDVGHPEVRGRADDQEHGGDPLIAGGADGDHDQPDRRLHDQQREQEQRPSQEQVGAPQVNLQLGQDAIALFLGTADPTWPSPSRAGRPECRAPGRRCRRSFVPREPARDHRQANDDDRAGDDEVPQRDRGTANRFEQPRADAGISIERSVSDKRKPIEAHAQIDGRRREREQGREIEPVRCPAPARRRPWPS